MGSFSFWHILVLAIILMLVFGGNRFSAMSIPAMIFMRATKPSWTHFGRSITSLRIPSRRCRTSTPFSDGSM